MTKDAKKNRFSAAILVYLLLCFPSIESVFAGAMPDQVDRLSNDLTPLGAERGGNEAGTIPPWPSGITEPPASATSK